jgi:hypothetical protein
VATDGFARQAFVRSTETDEAMLRLWLKFSSTGGVRPAVRSFVYCHLTATPPFVFFALTAP